MLCKGLDIAVVDSKLCGNCAFPQNFHTRKLGEITIFYAVQAFLVVYCSPTIVTDFSKDKIQWNCSSKWKKITFPNNSSNSKGIGKIVYYSHSELKIFTRFFATWNKIFKLFVETISFSFWFNFCPQILYV